MTLDRRNFIKMVGGVSGLALAGCASASHGPAVASGAAAELMPKGSARRVVVVGGGFGGTIAAKYIRMLDKNLEVVLIDTNDHFVSCPFSNLYIANLLPDLSSITIRYDKLASTHGVKLVQATATAVDPAAQTVVTSKGTIKYDRLVLSPGIGFRTEEIEGYDARTPDLMPHAWKKSGPQSVLLRNQLRAMKDGGTVVISAPLTPFRCPPGPYERASLIAHYLKQHKPKSKLILVDANPDIAAKKGLFEKGWNKYYKGVLEYRKASRVTAITAGKKVVLIEGIDEVKGDVINLVPPQRAADIAVKAGLSGPDKRWCPVDANTFESTLQKNIHVIGDASLAGAMPKSGYSANNQAKVCALNIVNLMNGRPVIGLSAINVCYSFLNDKEAVSVAAVFTVKDGRIISVPNAGGLSPDLSEEEGVYAWSWIRNILVEMST